jgi:hypothetical protein
MRFNMPVLGFIVLLVVSLFGQSQVQPDANGRTSNLPRRVVESVQTYIADHYESPEDYVVRQFTTHDIIFLGEMHGVRQNLEFLQQLLPRIPTSIHSSTDIVRTLPRREIGSSRTSPRP